MRRSRKPVWAVSSIEGSNPSLSADFAGFGRSASAEDVVVDHEALEFLRGTVRRGIPLSVFLRPYRLPSLICPLLPSGTLAYLCGRFKRATGQEAGRPTIRRRDGWVPACRSR
jgi:hypothetical protein